MKMIKNNSSALRYLALIPVVSLGLASIVASNGDGVGVGEVVFVSDRDGGKSELYRMGADGANPQRITHNSLTDSAPAWSPDKERIAFVRTEAGNDDIYIVNADGSNERRITTFSGLDAAPAWSPDGTKLAFESRRNNSSGDIWVVDLATNTFTNVTHLSVSRDSEPSWSPDGSQIAFQRYIHNNWEICLIAAGGFNDRCITNHPAHDEFPAWSPIESPSVPSKIAFESDRDNHRSAIYVMNPDGSGQTRLTDPQQDNLFPAWSPLGDAIVFESNRDNNMEIYKMNADGSGQVNISNNPARDGQPDW